MSVSVDSYKVFYHVAKQGSITAAARALYLSQPTVSQCISSMERELNCILFCRSKKGVTLTPEGELLFRHVSVACRHLWEAENELSALMKLTDGTVRIGATGTTLHHYLLPHLKQFKENYPHIKLKISNNNTPATLRALDTGLIDFAIIVTASEPLNGYRVYPLTEFQDILIGGPKYAGLCSHPLSIQDLCTYPLICMEPASVTRQFLEHFFLSHGAVLAPDIELETVDLITPMAENNLGIGFVPFDFASQKLREGKIFRLFLRETLPSRRICLVLSGEHPLSKAAGLFTSLLHESRPAPPAAKRRKTE